MTILILALTIISFNVNAQIANEIKSNKQGQAGYSIEAADQVELEKTYKRLCEKSSWMKCVENDKPKDALFSEVEKYTELKDNGKTQSVADADGKVTKVPIMEPVELERTIYYHPKNFTIIDKSQEVKDKKAEKEARKAETALIKKMNNEIKNSNLPEWHKKLLERLIKDIRE